MESIVIGLILFPAVISGNLNYVLDTKYINVPLDHFSFANNLTFKLRYLVNDTYHVERGPIFFYTGNEGDINLFAQNTGFMFDIAPYFNALIVFAEHRYYGTSLPFGNLSYTSPKYLGYLSSGQALADYVYLINDLQNRYATKELWKVPVVAFGGSYGGMLSAWLRMKYPSSVVGAIASSAPIWQFKDLTPCENFNRIVTNVFEGFGGEKCSRTIKNSWNAIRSVTKDDTGKVMLSKLWNLCTPLKTKDDIDNIIDWLTNVYTDLAMANYPYPVNFLAPLPAYPVREFCNRIQQNSYDYKNDTDILNSLGKALQVYTNYTKTTNCTNTVADNLGDSGWNFQACTEMIMPMCSTDLDMFENNDWDFKKYSDDCFTKEGVRPRSEDVPILEYGGKF
ncbi:hypothetical protein NQ318_016066 [Aromia moschata]|uniref:Lysosomal Pro-X carboxypeptidase n=1 Tax=Aromia moschata TaxID=1265417 RepID=A0AAV8XSB2_9CUCU|nr:hypothetical protein NQ318_016066 [Aromia moschata]